MTSYSSAYTHATNVSTDILTGGGTPGVNNPITASGTPSTTGLSISSGKLVISSGYSWYIECGLAIYASNGQTVIQIYNETSTAYVGQEAHCGSSGGGVHTYLRQTRKVARGLILAGDFGANSTLTVYPRVTSISGISSWALAGYTEPIIRVMRIG